MIDVDNPNRNVTPIDVPAVRTVLGQITINKVGENDAALAGAKFQLYRCNPGTTETNAGPITVNGTNTWTTGDDGSVILPAIQVEDFYNNAAQQDEFVFAAKDNQDASGANQADDLADLAQVADADLAKQAQVDHHQWDASAADHDGFDWAEFQQNWQATLDHAA